MPSRRSGLEVCGAKEGFEPSTFRLRVEAHLSSRCRPDPFWLLTSAGSSAEFVPDLPCYGRGNDQENDQHAAMTPLPLRATAIPSASSGTATSSSCCRTPSLERVVGRGRFDLACRMLA